MEALIRLLGKYDYSVITIQMITDEAKIGRRTFYRYFPTKDAVMFDTIRFYMSQLGRYFKEHLSGQPEEVSLCYFSFWEQNIDFLLLMQKAGLMYRIAEQFEDAVHDIAAELGHIPPEWDDRAILSYREQYKFAFGFRLAGYWKVTELWVQENPRRPAEEISRIMNAILS